MVNYKISAAAEEDLYNIWLYGFEMWGLEAADNYLHNLFAHFEQLAKAPLLYQAVDHVRQGYRRSVYEREAVYYRIENDTVQIMAVIGQQDLASRF